MKITLSVIKADIGSIGGHIKPGERMKSRVREYIESRESKLILDFAVTSTGDDIAILLSHSGGVGNSEIHKLAWNAFEEGTALAREMGLYGAGQDLLKDAFSGNVRGMGPAVAEMEFEERPNEPFIFFAADKTDPGAYNLPLYLAFCDPMYCSGLILSPKMSEGFSFDIMDVSYTEGDRVITLNAPEEIYDIAALLRDNQRFVVESIRSRKTAEIAVAVSTTRLHNIAGKYTGKDDPVMICRVQGEFPATGEVVEPYSIGHYVAGFMRGSHNGPLMPVRQNGTISYFDGPPVVSGAALCVHEGRFTEMADLFDHPLWDHVRDKISRKALEIREQGFSGAAMLEYNELEYGGIVERMKKIDERFKVREA